MFQTLLKKKYKKQELFLHYSTFSNMLLNYNHHKDIMKIKDPCMKR